MNLLLVAASEIRDGLVELTDARAEHLRTVLKVAPGQQIRAGIARGGVGTAEVVSTEPMVVRLSVGAPSQVMPVALVLALPRPKVLSRTLEIAASFAVQRIDLTNAWKVDKAYLKSPRLDAIEESLLRGAAQGATTHIPECVLHRRLMPLVDTLHGGLIAHPGAPPIEQVYKGGPTTVAIGPEGGWIDREVETFVARGFQPVSLGAPILRVEAAVAALLGQLALLARMMART